MFNIKQYKSNDIKLSFSENQSIDDIFATADSEMSEQNSAFNITPKKNKKRHPILKRIIIIFSIFVLFILIIIGMLFYNFKQQYPIIKNNIINQYTEYCNDLNKSNDADLTVEEYYQKQVMTLLTEDDVKQIIDSSQTKINIFNLFKGKSVIECDTSLVTKEKSDKYNQITNEYQSYIQSGGDPNAKYNEITK